MEDEGEDFRSWDEDDYISVGAQITLDMKRVGHCVPELKPRMLNNVKGDNNKTLVTLYWFGVRSSR